MIERLLPQSEWPRLAGTLLDPAWRSFSSSDKVIVVEEDGQIIACTSLTQQWHLEGTWVHPDYRHRVSVGRRLVRTMRDLFRAMHVGEVLMMARTPETAKMCQKLGPTMLLACEHFAVCVGKGDPLWQAR